MIDGDERLANQRTYIGCDYHKYLNSKGCILNPRDIGLNIHFVHFQVLL